ncbi:hypothetical protein [Pleomorphovibrio marinus]|uniref:hypothetical protein n=1 Tax=Pleomorphovibrio marinus TaxID=2164132 RepID=UPI001300AF52|nr:hypothetical protein [Pleomorphovibrio marinus]
MLRFFFLIPLIFINLSVFGQSKQKITINAPDHISIQYGIKQLSKFYTEKGLSVDVSSKEEGDDKVDVLIILSETPMGIEAEGFRISQEQTTLRLEASDAAGAMYGILDILDQLKTGGTLGDIRDKTINPAHAFRGIKFNLPWSSYREHESLQVHTNTVRDLTYWEKFFDMMAENRFNAITLFSIHPWPFMVKSDKYPEASSLSEGELKEWIAYWHTLFGMAKERSIKVFMVNFNIYVSPEFARAHDVAKYSEHLNWGYNGKGDYSPLVQEYNREMVKLVLEEYPELSGIGVSQNERMEGVTEEVWQQWIVDTYFDLIGEAKPEREFFLRGHTHPAPDLTREAVEKNKAILPSTVWLDLKFNWSHGHATPDLHYIHGGSDSDFWWNPTPENYQVVFTIRNEDFFVLRWGQADFIRQLLQKNNLPGIGGYLIGSETYIPAYDYITRPGAHKTWEYAFEKQWLFYQTWGRLLYDPKTEDSHFVESFDKRYAIDYGDKLFEAHQLVGIMPLRLASYFGATWDFTLYSEGFLSGFRPWRGEVVDNTSAFLSIEEIIGSKPISPDWLNIAEYVKYTLNSQTIPEEKTTPLELARELEDKSSQALDLLKTIKSNDPTLMHEVADIKAWAYLAKYFAAKLQAGVEFETYKGTKESNYQKQALASLQKAKEYWSEVIKITSPYFEEIPLLHFGDDFLREEFEKPVDKFSWKNFEDQVQRDIDYVRNFKE